MKKTIISLVLLLALCFTFAGCCIFPTAEPIEPVATVLIVGAHSNFPYQGSLSSLTDSIYESCYTYGTVTIVVADGEPYVAADYNVKKPKANVDKSKRKMLAEEKTATIVKKIFSCTAKTPSLTHYQRWHSRRISLTQATVRSRRLSSPTADYRPQDCLTSRRLSSSSKKIPKVSLNSL